MNSPWKAPRNSFLRHFAYFEDNNLIICYYQNPFLNKIEPQGYTIEMPDGKPPGITF